MPSMDLRQSIGSQCGFPGPQCSHQHDQERKYNGQCKCGSAEAVAAGELDAVELPVGQQVQSKAAASFGEAEKGNPTCDSACPHGLGPEHFVHLCSHCNGHAQDCPGQAEQLQA